MTAVTEEYVCQGNQRKYYRFRADRFYGGIATADCMGCNMDCAFCWSYRTRLHPEQFGRFYTPPEVARRLVKIAHEHGFRAVRISGNEPTLCKQHLLEVIKAVERLDPDLLFMLETNGVKLGEDVAFVEELSRCRNVHVRLSFKTGTAANFELITGRPKEWFELQLRAVEHLYAKRVSFHVAIVADYAHEYLIERLLAVGPGIVERIEHEYLQLYPHVRHRMKERGLVPVGNRGQ
jgi:uncharacterized Fe-S cluster-containing radical SAM superfamily protein